MGISRTLVLILSLPVVQDGAKTANELRVAEMADGSLALSTQSYRARFEADGVAFSARDPKGEAEARFRLLSVGRRSGPLAAPEAALPVRAADGVRYERGAVSEMYEARPEGLEQSFAFTALPAGSGDLVVRIAVETDLPLVHAEARELLLGARGTPGIRIGEVVGVDAHGARVRGALGWSDGVLELSLPETFVRVAALPLVLDPLISSPAVFATFSKDPNIVRPQEMLAVDAAYLPGADLYCAVWVEHDGGAESGRITRGRLLRSDGSLTGAAFGVDGTLVYSDRPQVAAVASARRFAVAVIGGLSQCEAPNLVSVDEAGVVRGTPTLFLDPFDAESIDVGGEATPAADDVLVAYATYSGFTTSIEIAQVDILSLQTVAKLALTPAGSDDRSVAITKSGGSAGRYLVAWSRGPSGAGDIFGAVVDRDLDVLVPPCAIAATAANEDTPDVDGDGTHWMVAFERTNTTGDRDLVCRAVSYDEASGAARLGAERVVEGDAGQEELEPAVAWMGESYLVGFIEQFSGADWDVFVRSVDSIACANCEGEFVVFNPVTTEEAVGIASQPSGGGSGDEALVAWVTTTAQTSPQLGPPFLKVNAQERLFRADDGSVLDLGGGCGAGGIASATCASSAEGARFGVRLAAAAPRTRAFLALGIAPLGAGCGPCRLMTEPFQLLAARTDAAGTASVSLPLPASVSLPGTTFLAQWLVDSPNGCSALDAKPGFVFSVSNALQITVQ